ncbi:hypothetical protein J2792_001372 [Novosphingobium capsulatum]|uniref:Uncharacterized protein n=1 Tax=Novosphingobium capsulatum TaxID=13688 RepID=A0ABU1MJM0_9SPHN|nr:hypothetical protein [Novosphingobium capsulatum]
MNDGLAHGRYFFMDVARNGIALYQSEDTELHQPKPKTPHAALAMAKEYFEEWMPGAVAFNEGTKSTSVNSALKKQLFPCIRRRKAYTTESF